MTVSFSGLASGIDSKTLISQLVAVERASGNGLAQQQSNISTQKTIIGNLSSQLSTLRSIATDLKTSSALQFRKATTTDTHMSIAVSGEAQATTHAIRVTQMARGQVVTSKAFASDTAGIAGTGYVDITTGTAAAVRVSWTASDTLTTIASKINGANAGQTASVLYDGSQYRLVLTAKNTGTAAASTFADSASGGLDLSSAANVRIAGQDAKVTVDGVEVVRATNVIGDAIPGVTITANSVHATADSDALVTVSLDTDATKKKLQSLVDAYNSVNSVIAGQLTYFGTKKGADTLFGDSALRMLQGQLSTVLTSSWGSSNLGAIGISRDKTGAMSLDASKLSTALASDPTAVEKVFVTGGFATSLASLAEQYSRSGDGILALKSSALTQRSTLLGKQIAQINKNADDLQARLQKQFTSLEEAMGKLQGQASYINKMLV